MSGKLSKNKTIKKPNPLFEQWISEWLKEATENKLEVRHGYRRVSILIYFKIIRYN